MTTTIMMRKQESLSPDYLSRASMTMNQKRRTKSNKFQLKRPNKKNLERRSPTKSFREIDLTTNLNQGLKMPDLNQRNQDRVQEVQLLLRKV